MSKANQKFLAGVLALTACLLLIVFVSRTPVIGQSVFPGGSQITLADNTTLTAFQKVGAAGLWYDGATLDLKRGVTTWKAIAAIDARASASNTVWTPTSTKKFRLMGGVLSASTASDLAFGEGIASTSIGFRIFPLGATANSFDLKDGILSTTADNVLVITGTVDTSISGSIWGMEE